MCKCFVVYLPIKNNVQNTKIFLVEFFFRWSNNLDSSEENILEKQNVVSW